MIWFLFFSLPPSPVSLDASPLWLSHSRGWGNSMWKYAPCFTSSLSVDLSTLQTLLQSCHVSTTVLHFSLWSDRTHITLSQYWHIFYYLPYSPLSLWPFCRCYILYTIYAGIIYRELHWLREWEGGWAFTLSLGLTEYAAYFTLICFVQSCLNLSQDKGSTNINRFCALIATEMFKHELHILPGLLL